MQQLIPKRSKQALNSPMRLRKIRCGETISTIYKDNTLLEIESGGYSCVSRANMLKMGKTDNATNSPSYDFKVSNLHRDMTRTKLVGIV